MRGIGCVVAIAVTACTDGDAERATDAGRRLDAARARDASRKANQPPPEPPVRLFAARYVARIYEAPDKDAPRVGYMRAGAVVRAKTADPIGHDKCRKGWFELETGGFACATQDVTPFRGQRLPERRPRQPDLSARLPYPYGYSRSRNTPVFRRLPTAEEAAEFEKAAGRTARSGPEEGRDAEADVDGGTPPGAEPPDAAVPTLASLQGDPDSVLLRRMERGFYVSLDSEMKKGRRRYWRTQANGFIPFRRLLRVQGSDFAGVELGEGEEASRLPLGWVKSSRYWAYAKNERGRLRRAGRPGYHHRFAITEQADLRGRTYFVGGDGRHYRARRVAYVSARGKPEEVGPKEKWLDVDLTTQSLVAYVGERPVYATLVSTGRVRDENNPLRDFATPTGAFRIHAKHVTATMQGDHAVDGPYSIEDVPYVMFFYRGGYALHSAFWHNRFGRPRSHGCVNLAPEDARFLFNWVEPAMPEHWHGVYARPERPGTRIYVRGETPQR